MNVEELDTKGPYPLDGSTVTLRESADSRRPTQSVVIYQTCLIKDSTQTRPMIMESRSTLAYPQLSRHYNRPTWR